jgi:DNA-binding XRE family transcriptional regulator
MSTASDTAPAAQPSLERGAHKLRAERLDQGLTRKEHAARVGISPDSLTNIENGNHRPSLERARRLSDALGVRMDTLFPTCECACGCGELLIDQARHGSAARYLSGHNCRAAEHGASISRAHQARRARLGIPEEKTCERCGRTFSRAEVPNQSLAHWLKRRFCSNDCFCPERGEPRSCAICGGDFLPSYRAEESRRCCCGSHGQLYRFQEGNVAPEFIAHMPSRARQRHVGRWEGRKYGQLGGRPAAQLTDEQRIEVKRLSAKGWGRRAIANRLAVSEWAVRTVIAS